MRPTEVTEIHVFRMILQSSWNKNACTRTVTRTDPEDDSFQTLTSLESGLTWNSKSNTSPGGYFRCIAPVRGPQPMNFPPLPICRPAKEILSISYALTRFWKLYGDTDSGQRLLPSLSGSTSIIVLDSLPGWVGL